MMTEVVGENCVIKGVVPAEVSVIVPCYNEVDNIKPVVMALRRVLQDYAWEVIFVDDHSPDGTIQAVRSLAHDDCRVRGLCRIGRKGLSSAVIEGVMASSAPIVVVMDGDLQHDEKQIPCLIEAVQKGYDLAVGSRHVEGGDNGGLANAWRRALSDYGNLLAKSMLPVKLSDPMSGFFAIRRAVFEEAVPHLSGRGFKILVDLVLSSSRAFRVQEVPYMFRSRVSGESKLDVFVMFQFLGLLIDHFFHGWFPVRFLVFCAVGLVGLVVNFAVMYGIAFIGVSALWAQHSATFVAMIVNFVLNNHFTYRDRRLRGIRCWIGVVLFILICTVDVVANVGIAQVLYDQQALLDGAGIAGAVLAVVWNYALSSTFVWRE